VVEVINAAKGASVQRVRIITDGMRLAESGNNALQAFKQRSVATNECFLLRASPAFQLPLAFQGFGACFHRF
jgi:hypothetical protein